MNDIFGIPMSTVLVALIAMFSLALLFVAFIAWRRPVLFKLGVRNIPRRRAQSTLIVVGLMLSTLIISAALGVGDTLHHSTSSDVYRQLGHVDALVLRSPDFTANRMTSLMENIDERDLALTEEALAGNEDVDGIMPLLDVRVPVMNHEAGQSEPNAILTGIDPTRLEQFDGLRSTDGGTIDLTAIPDGQVVISEKAAEVLDAKVGDTLTIAYNNEMVELVVWDITPNTTLAGYRETAVSMVMPLERLQTMTNQPTTLTGIAISTTGGVRNTDTDTAAILDVLRPAFEGQDLGVDIAKADTVEMSEDLASMFTSLFLVLGLFSVSAGVLLIVLIFTMLAAERRSEMGMARAVGTHRRQLIQQFIAEGSAYAILSGLVGSALGVLATFGIAKGMGALLGEFLTIEPHVTLRSLVAAYTLGMVITFVAVAASSWKISRLNVVAAVRDITEVTVATRKKSGLVWGIVFVLLGGLMVLQGLGSDMAFPFYAGMSLAPLGLARIAQFFGAPSRPVYSVVGVALLALWMLPQDVATKLFGELDGDMEMFFLSGIFMVIGATMLIVQNTDALLSVVSRFGGLFRGKLPAIRTAVAYPGAAPGRTGMTIAMFSLIIFSLVTISTMNANYSAMMLGDDANAGWHVRADVYSANPIDDFTGTLEVSGVATDDFTAVGTVTSPSPFGSNIRVAGTDSWKQTSVYGMDEGFLQASEISFQQHAEGYESDEAVIEALWTEPNVAVVHSWMLEIDGATMDENSMVLTGLTSGQKTFAPYEIELANQDGTATTLRVIGVIDSEISTLNGLFTSQATLDAVYGETAMTSYYVALADEDRATDVAQDIEAALMVNGAQGVSIQDELKAQQQQEAGFLYLVQGFMALGLFVGIAAVGVIAYRSVVERRQQIGVLRALGYQRGMVSLSFLIETAFIVGMGVLSGVTLAVVLSRNMFTADAESSGVAFTVPWVQITVMALATVVIALVMTWMPSRQAARIAPAEALRYE
ncbi:MAG TPA: FtsX-like permease family protein [Thermomicrobiales bacterium]|nr:FtsX-like permease family protein [Thermomicrobiales bacterium]